MAAISVENLTKNYGRQTAIDNISFTIQKEGIVGFIGPNGAGKSSTMRMLTGYMAPTTGKIFINGHDIDKYSKRIKKQIGYLPENNPLYSDMAVVDYLKFCADIQSMPSSTIAERIKTMIEVCGLNPEKHKRIYELSKGYRQRVGLAQALIHDPEILILDEPTTGLDPNQIIEIRTLIKELGREKTIILSSHILPEIEAICDRVIIINLGKIVTDSSMESMRQDAIQQEILIIQVETDDPTTLLTAISNLASVETVESIIGKKGFYQIRSKPQMSSRKPVFEVCVKLNSFLLEMRSNQSRLENWFREVTH
jgi:ABC-2 type transport system ATP-binding protein